MSKYVDDLMGDDSTVQNAKLLDYIIGIQLNKIEKNQKKSKDILNDKSEKAMANLIELMKIRSKY